MPRSCLGRQNPQAQCMFGIRGGKAQVELPYTRCYFCDEERLRDALLNKRNNVVKVFRNLSEEQQVSALQIVPVASRAGFEQLLA
eukprot:1716087-Karenia_brevis.AAC.1